MTQFDVYRNPSADQGSVYPYILDIQNDLLDELTTRIVVPLAPMSSFHSESISGLTPKVTIDNEDFLILIPQIAAMPTAMLNKPIGSLTHLRDEIIAALDLAITGF